MEEQFVFEYVPTIKIIASHIRKRQPLRVIIFLVMGIGLFLYMLNFALMYQFRGISLIFFLIGVVYLVWALAMPEINAYFEIRRMQKSFEGEYPVCTISFGDSIEILEGTVRVIWEYNDIKCIRRYKYTYVLEKNKHMGIVLDPKGLTGGSFEAFKAFLLQKCPDLTFPE